MKNVARFVFSGLTSLSLVTAVWALPARQSQSNPATQQKSEQTQSVSGKIASVANDSFTLTVSAATSQQLAQQPANLRTMTFRIDKNTTVEGQLKVNANADVTYREDNGSNVAISVRVTP
ncbi:MAG TPA: hypothetical protein VFQ18_07130 [Candidatus Acidoferrum sp.]|nr:hypothetical protein [Candidatus Acidoferrum sp.]